MILLESVDRGGTHKIILKGKKLYEAFCFYFMEELAQRIGCYEVTAKEINLTPGFLKKQHRDNIESADRRFKIITVSAEKLTSGFYMHFYSVIRRL